VIQAIHISVKGRARYKIHGLFRSDSLKKHIESKLNERAGIQRFSINILTGNILVFFNSDQTHSDIALIIEKILANRTGLNSSGSPLNSKKRNNTSQQKIPKTQPKSSQRRSIWVARNAVDSRRRLRRSIVHAESQPIEYWHLMPESSVTNLTGTDREKGLSTEAANENLKKFGPNILPESVPRSGFSIFINQFKSIPVALLGVAAVISVSTGGLADALVIIAVVGINALIGYASESGTEKTIHSLKTLVRPSAMVIRDAKVHEISSGNVVPGDLIILRPGTYVTADARLIESDHLSVDESALTGESMPVKKTISPILKDNIPLAERTNMVYMGTLVTGGQGVAVIVATGRFTEIGNIQTILGDAQAPDTPLERKLDEMGKQLVIISGAVCGMVFIVGLLHGYGFLEMLKSSIALAVAAVPEGLPAIATTTLALGIRNMRKHNVLIRHLEAVETLGSVQTICLDKTGTLTMNRMSVQEIFTGTRLLRVSEGKFITDNDYVSPYTCNELLMLIHVCVLCNESEIIHQNGKYVVTGSPTENSFIHLAIEAGVDVEQLRRRNPLLKVVHRSEKRNVMLTVHSAGELFVEDKASTGQKKRGKRALVQDAGHKKILAVKGSPREVLDLCAWYMKDGVQVPMSEEARLLFEMENEQMAGKAYRVLGSAYAYTDNKAAQNGEDVFLPRNFIWLGIIGLADPVRKGVKNLIKDFHHAGIDTVMITGDQSPTAYAVAKELDLSKGEQLEILDSRHLTDIPPDILKALCERVHVFARVSPSHKLQIVQSLQSAGKVIAMTGDGINDGPALKAADIGIAMGHTGTDVAREVADVILEDDNLQTMIIAVSHGRTIYNNIRKSVHFLLSTNMSEIMVMFTAITLGLGQPLNTMQLLWINLLSDIFPGLALALEPPEPDVLSQSPRDPGEAIIRPSDFKRITFEAAAISAGTLGAYGYGIMRYGIGPRASTLAFSSLTVGQLMHSLSCRSEEITMFSREKLPQNKYLNIALGGSFALQILAMTVPGIRGLLGLAPIGIIDGMVIGVTALLPYFVNEATKNIRISANMEAHAA
jgi:Ca2+-transporting ATPase